MIFIVTYLFTKTKSKKKTMEKSNSPGSDILDDSEDEDQHSRNRIQTTLPLLLSTIGWTRGEIEADYVILAPTHVDPKIQVAIKSGLEIDSRRGGVVVNSQLEAVADVFVAGGVASYYDISLGRRRLERLDHSINSGILAGHNMCVGTTTRHSNKRRYDHQPMFRSNMEDIGVQCDGVGDIDSRMKTVGIWVANRRRAQLINTSATSDDLMGTEAINNNVKKISNKNNSLIGSKKPVLGQLLYTSNENQENDVLEKEVQIKYHIQMPRHSLELSF